MTITANPVRNQYIAAPNQTVFNYTYKIYSDNDLSVYVTPAGQAPDDSADLITSYTVDPGTIGNQSGGFITLDTGANSGDIITIASAIQYDRETDYQTNGDFSPETVNGDIDRVVSLVKQNKGLINRAVLAPASGGGEDEPISFPIPDDQKGLKWESGNLANTPIVEGVTTDSNEFGLVSTTGNEVKIRGLKSGQNVTLTDDGTDILIKAEVQGGQGDVSSSSSNTYAPGTTQAFDAATANTMSVGGVDVAAKNTEQDSEISANSSFNNGFKSDSSYGVGTSAPKVVSISNISGSKKYEVNFKGGFTSGGATGCNFKVDIETSPGLGSVDIIYILDFTRNGQAITFTDVSSLNPNESNTLINQPILFNSSDDIGGLSFCMSLNTPTEAKAIESISISYIDSGGTIGVPTLFISSQPAKP